MKNLYCFWTSSRLATFELAGVLMILGLVCFWLHFGVLTINILVGSLVGVRGSIVFGVSITSAFVRALVTSELDGISTTFELENISFASKVSTVKIECCYFSCRFIVTLLSNNYNCLPFSTSLSQEDSSASESDSSASESVSLTGNEAHKSAKVFLGRTLSMFFVYVVLMYLIE